MTQGRETKPRVDKTVPGRVQWVCKPSGPFFMSETSPQEAIAPDPQSPNDQKPSTNKRMRRLIKRGWSLFAKRTSAGALAGVVFLGLFGGTSISLAGQGFLFAADDSFPGGSYIEEVYIEALTMPQEDSPFLVAGPAFSQDFALLDYDESRDDDYNAFLIAYLSPTNFPSYEAGVDRRAIVQHTVRESETLSYIAAAYHVSIDTIKWANKISNPDALTPGVVLDILPVSGVAHLVRNGDTIDAIALKYKADAQTVIAFNALPADGAVRVGDTLIVPGGALPVPPKAPMPTRVTSPRVAQNAQTLGYFIAPTTGRNWGRRHANNGVDVANSCGTPIYSAAEGTVAKVMLTDNRTRRANGGYGNYVVVRHPNGTETLYAHLLADTTQVSVGAAVKQGQLLAQMGGKPGTPGAGRSTGCHLHFEVHGGTNPLLRR